jgi:hypothetical protein
MAHDLGDVQLHVPRLGLLHLTGLVSALATHCGAGRLGLHGAAAGICLLCDGLCNTPGSVPLLWRADRLNRTSVSAAVVAVLLFDPVGSLVAAYLNLIVAGNKYVNHKGILRGFGNGLGGCPGHHYCGALGQCGPLWVYLFHAV